MQIELSQLELTYAALRISQSAAQSQLTARLCAVGQQSPVVVVAVEPPVVPERFVLIDGYRRVEALRQLGNDTVEAVVLALPAADALLWHRRQDASRRRTALEDGWLLRELREQHAITGVEIARRLGRSSSWVSRRLSLVDTLPERVQQLVRSGTISPQAAMKYLVPLARAKSADCEQLAENLGGQRISVRQMRQLYVAWRRSEGEQRRRLVESPTLYLQAAAEAAPSPASADAEVLSDLEAIEAISRRLARRLRADQAQGESRAVSDAFSAASRAFDALFAWLKG